MFDFAIVIKTMLLIIALIASNSLLMKSIKKASDKAINKVEHMHLLTIIVIATLFELILIYYILY